MNNLLLLAITLSVFLPTPHLLASTTPAADANADHYCTVHGCGDLPPMDFIDD